MVMEEKYRYYFKRTMEHIARVQANALYLTINCSKELNLSLINCKNLMWSVMVHDSSKFSDEQFEAYVDFSWHKKTGCPLTNEQQNDFELAWVNHYQTENHHPERLKGNALKMSDLEIIEVVCDLQAMAEEFNEGTCRNYYEKSWKKNQTKNFYDDFNWYVEVESEMDAVIKCFEMR